MPSPVSRRVIIKHKRIGKILIGEIRTSRLFSDIFPECAGRTFAEREKGKKRRNLREMQKERNSKEEMHFIKVETLRSYGLRLR
uniref:Uncharacterized protein n=1 Tax=Steinernema glaseri TaxID=37863 RepID=A0A1I7ZDW9_9BILA